jgi:hypothetical protein
MKTNVNIQRKVADFVFCIETGQLYGEDRRSFVMKFNEALSGLIDTPQTREDCLARVLPLAYAIERAYSVVWDAQKGEADMSTLRDHTLDLAKAHTLAQLKAKIAAREAKQRHNAPPAGGLFDETARDQLTLF